MSPAQESARYRSAGNIDLRHRPKPTIGRSPRHQRAISLVGVQKADIHGCTLCGARPIHLFEMQSINNRREVKIEIAGNTFD